MAGDKKDAPTIELPLERFERLLVLLERLCQAQERMLAQKQDNAVRAARKLAAQGPVTVSPEVEARVRARMEKWK